MLSYWSGESHLIPDMLKVQWTVCCVSNSTLFISNNILLGKIKWDDACT